MNDTPAFDALYGDFMQHAPKTQRLRSIVIDDELSKQNQRLVEHAPKLLKACETALDWFRATSTFTGKQLGADVQQQLLEAITLATGEPPHP